MKRIALSFEHNLTGAFWGHADRRPVRQLAALVMLLAFGALGAALWRCAAAHFALETARSEIAAQNATAARAGPVFAGIAPVPPHRLVAMGRMTQHLNTPWPSIFDVLERHTSKEVALLSIEPDAIKNSVHLEVEARTLPALLELAQRLGSSPAFRPVAISRHEVVERDPNKPFRMSLDAALATATGDASLPAKP